MHAVEKWKDFYDKIKGRISEKRGRMIYKTVVNQMEEELNRGIVAVKTLDTTFLLLNNKCEVTSGRLYT